MPPTRTLWSAVWTLFWICYDATKTRRFRERGPSRAMGFVAYPLATALGLVLGSFYTALASRILYFAYGPGRRIPDRWKTILLGRSFCMHCQTPIEERDLIPVLSFALLRGRCRHCSEPLGWHTLAGELFFGLLFPLLILSGQGWPGSLYAMLFCGHLYIAIATDYNLLLLDHENALFLLLWAVAFSLYDSALDPGLFARHGVAAGIALALFLVLYVAARGKGLGFGDVLLAGLIGLFLGIPWTLFAIVFGATASVIYIVYIRRDRSQPAPLGAGMALGVMLTLVVRAIYRMSDTAVW